MPITTSAKKAMRQTRRRAVINRKRKDALKKQVKNFRTLVAAKKMDEAKAALAAVYKLADKTAKKNVIKTNNARRIKSRLAKLLK